MRWERGRTFEIELLDTVGTPRSGWRVRMYDSSGSLSDLFGTSDSRGIVRLRGIDPGVTYRLAVFSGSSLQPVLRRDSVDTSRARLTLRIDSAKTRPGAIRGRFVADGD